MIKITDKNEILEKRNLKLTRKNIEKIAYDYGCIIKEFKKNFSAILKDDYNRLLFVWPCESDKIENATNRIMNKILGRKI